MMVFPFLMQGQDNVKLKQINIVKTNYQNSKDGEIVNKTMVFKDGKLQTITTSDVVQHFL